MINENFYYLTMISVIKNPEITKNISTPMNPPVIKLGHAWKIITKLTAIALIPSISGPYEKFEWNIF